MCAASPFFQPFVEICGQVADGSSAYAQKWRAIAPSFHPRLPKPGVGHADISRCGGAREGGDLGPRFVVLDGLIGLKYHLAASR
jgi:hypothetical protein